MAYKASAHAVYDLKYHIVWTPQYRKALLVGEVAQAVQELFDQIAAAYDLEIDTMEVMEDHVHVFLSAPPRYAPARIAQILTSISARELFARFPGCVASSGAANAGKMALLCVPSGTQ